MGQQAQNRSWVAGALGAVRRVGREPIALACLLLWYGLAFHVSVEPEFSFPVWFLAHPRRDLSWLVFLLTLAGVWGGLWAALLCGAPRVAKGLWKVLAVPAAVPVTAVAMALGAALVTFEVPAAALRLTGAVVAGVGFAGAATIMAARSRVLARGSRQVLLMGAVALGIASFVKFLLLLVAQPVIYGLVCLLSLGLIPTVPRTTESSADAPVAQPVDDARSLHGDHVSTVLVCFGGLGLFLGIIGFGTDAMPQGPLLSYHLVTAAFGSALGCAGLLAFGRRSPDVPFVLLPVLLGTVALLLPFESNPALGWLAMVLGKTVDVWAFVLMAAVLGELLRMHAGEPTAALRPMAGSLALAALLMLAGILIGGILMSVVGRDATAMALVAVSLVYVTMLALGVSAQRRSQSNYIIVRNPQDVARIAAAQAQAIFREYPALSPRELDVLRLLLQHQTIDRMAEELGISRNTVKSHIAHLYEKTGLNSRQQLVDLAAAKTVQL